MVDLAGGIAATDKQPRPPHPELSVEVLEGGGEETEAVFSDTASPQDVVVEDEHGHHRVA